VHAAVAIWALSWGSIAGTVSVGGLPFTCNPVSDLISMRSRLIRPQQHLPKVWVLGVCRVSCAPYLSGCLAALRVCPKFRLPKFDDARILGSCFLPSLRRGWKIPGRDCHIGLSSHSLGSGGVLGLFLKLNGVLLVLLADLVELPHVLEEVGASLKSDEKLGFLAITSVV